VVACRVTDAMWDDGNNLGPLDIHNFLTRIMYNRRNKFDPLWNTLVLGGVKNGIKYLGSVSATLSYFAHTHVNGRMAQNEFR
jgi:20S proteasome subunit beta 7